MAVYGQERKKVMTTNRPNMRICLKNKRIYLNRVAISLIGNPTHLRFSYDEQGGILYFSPADPSDLDAYEIPRFYWTGIRKTCEIARIAFLRALQYRIGLEDGSTYYYDGEVMKTDETSALAYRLTQGTRIR
jgi:hypothetical protein